MWVTEIRDFLSATSIKIAWIIFLSSIVFLIPPSSWFSIFRLESYHQNTIKNYDVQIFIALIVSLVLIIFDLGSRFWEWWNNRKAKLVITKATYGIDKTRSIDVTDRVKALIEASKDKLSFTVDDDVLLEMGKKDDPMPGSNKIFRIEYSYKHIKEYKQGEKVEITN